MRPVIEAYAVADVRAAEEAAMAGPAGGRADGARRRRAWRPSSPPGCAERDGVRVVGLVGAGNNGGDALYALARLAREGFAAAARPRRDGARRWVGGGARGRRGAGVG